MSTLPTNVTRSTGRDAHIAHHNVLHERYNSGGGGGGGGGVAYTHNQSSPSVEWIVAHNLGYHPKVHVEDSTGRVVYGPIDHVNENTLVLTWTNPFSGTAYLT